MTYREMIAAKESGATVRIVEPPFIGYEGRIERATVVFGLDWLKIVGADGKIRAASLNGVVLV